MGAQRARLRSTCLRAGLLTKTRLREARTLPWPRLRSGNAPRQPRQKPAPQQARPRAPGHPNRLGLRAERAPPFSHRGSTARWRPLSGEPSHRRPVRLREAAAARGEGTGEARRPDLQTGERPKASVLGKAQLGEKRRQKFRSRAPPCPITSQG